MYRNCIRNTIMPIVNKEVCGWQKSVLALSGKMRDDESVLHGMAHEAFENSCTVKDCLEGQFHHVVRLVVRIGGDLAAWRRHERIAAREDRLDWKRIPLVRAPETPTLLLFRTVARHLYATILLVPSATPRTQKPPCR